MQRVGRFSAEPSERCPVCGRAVKMMLEYPSGNGTVKREVPATCECVEREQDAKDAQAKSAAKAAMEKMRLERAFGDRSVTGSFDCDDGRNPRLMDACSAYVEMFDGIRGQKVNGLLLYGPTRKGKTFAAEAVAMKLHNSGRKVLMDTAAGFVQKLQTLNGNEREALMARIANCDLLVVDDFGASRDTSFGKEAVFSVIDKRVSANGPMLVTTNLDISAMAGAIEDKRTAFRIMERCLSVEVDPNVGISANADHGKLASMIFDL